MNVTDRFLKYVSFDTMSAEDADTIPSTKKQFALAEYIADELKRIGLTDVRMDEHCYVYGCIPANCDCDVSVGFISHFDTSPEVSDTDVRPSIVEYNGGDIVLNKQLDIVMREDEFECLKNYYGQHLIVTDGTTLLGADDKAGLAEIVSACEYIINSGVKHGRIMVGFTPDEEVGHGADMFDVKGFGCDFAYTVDGGAVGEIEYENFNAASAAVSIRGKSIHTGWAKNKLVNAITIGEEFDAMLPQWERPEHTEGYEGFYHMARFSGGIESCTLNYIIRDHDAAKFAERKAVMRRVTDYLNARYGDGTVTTEIRDSYPNMRQIIEKNMHVVDRLIDAMKACDVTPIIVPIRGGTDGARLSYMGLPCPNMCTGGENFHGRYEFISTEALEKVTEIVIKLMTTL